MPDFVSPGGHRFYSVGLIERVSSPLVESARVWVLPANAPPLPKELYHANSAVFLTRLNQLSQDFKDYKAMNEIAPLVVAIAGEIGNNSFDHNLGNWPDVPGIFFDYDLKRRQLVLADRGQGVLQTLKRVRPSLRTAEEALHVAFTQSISGRAPEKRGNGLKFVRTVVTERAFGLMFQSKNAQLTIDRSTNKMELQTVSDPIHGTLAVLHF